MLKLSLFFCLYQLAFDGVANWANCRNSIYTFDDCEKDGNGNKFVCCEAPGGDNGKTTCRPHWECSNNNLPNWKTCFFGNTCAPDAQGNVFKCCAAEGDMGKATCRPHWECQNRPH